MPNQLAALPLHSGHLRLRLRQRLALARVTIRSGCLDEGVGGPDDREPGDDQPGDGSDQPGGQPDDDQPGGDDPRDPEEWWHDRPPEDSWRDDDWHPTPVEEVTGGHITFADLAPLVIKELWLAVGAILLGAAVSIVPNNGNLGWRLAAAVFVIGSLAFTITAIKKWQNPPAS